MDPQSSSQVPSTSLLVNTGVNISNRPITVAPQISGSAPVQSSLATIAALQQRLSNQLKQAGVAIPPNLLSAPSAAVSNQQRTPHSVLLGVDETRKWNFKVRIINPSRKKEYDTYILRDVTKAAVSTPMHLRKELYEQFGAELISSDLDFAVGYMKGNSKVTIHSSADIDDVWTLSSSSKGETVVLWCDRVKKRNAEFSDDDSELEDDIRPKTKKKKLSALEKKNERVESIVQKLRSKHGGKYTTIQLRLWAEVLDVGKWK